MSRSVAVLGGGLAGLSCAYELARAGAEVTPSWNASLTRAGWPARSPTGMGRRMAAAVFAENASGLESVATGAEYSG